MNNNYENAIFAQCLKQYRPRQNKFPKKLKLSDDDLYWFLQADRTAVGPEVHGNVKQFLCNLKNAIEENKFDNETLGVAQNACAALEVALVYYENQSYLSNKHFEDHSAMRNM